MDELGYSALFIASFLSATILPMSSEAIVAGMAVASFNPWWVLAVATIGNWLGSVVTYLMGYVGDWSRIERWLKIGSSKTARYIAQAKRYGAWLGFFVWVPAVGDVFALCMGLVRCNMVFSFVSILIGKLVRYAIIIYLIKVGLS